MYRTKLRFNTIKSIVEQMNSQEDVDVQFHITKCNDAVEVIRLAQELKCKVMYQKNSCELPYFVYEFNNNVTISVFQ